MDGSTFEVTVPEDILIKDLKSQIKEQSKLNENEMRLIFKAKVLGDEQKLNDFIKEDGLSVHLVKRPPAVPANDPNEPQPEWLGSAPAGTRPNVRPRGQE